MHSKAVVYATEHYVLPNSRLSSGSGFPCNLQGSFQQLLSIDMCRGSRVEILPGTDLPLEYESTSLLRALQHTFKDAK